MMMRQQDCVDLTDLRILKEPADVVGTIDEQGVSIGEERVAMGHRRGAPDPRRDLLPRRCRLLAAQCSAKPRREGEDGKAEDQREGATTHGGLQRGIFKETRKRGSQETRIESELM